MSRKSTPDVMGEIMGSTAMENNKAIKEASNKTIKQVSNKAIKPESNNVLPREELKEKATFNLPVSVIEQIEDAWMKLRRSGKEKRITKTLIVETAVKITLQEYEEKGLESKLFKNL